MIYTHQKLHFLFDLTQKPHPDLDAVIERRMHQAAIKRELELRDMAMTLLDQGYLLSELCIYEPRAGLLTGMRHFAVAPLPNVNVSKFRLWARRILIRLGVRPSARELYRELDRKKKPLEIKLWQR